MQLPAVGIMLHNSQAEMFQGVGGYDYGADLNPFLTGHSVLGVTCNDCHMNRNEGVTHQMLMTENTADRLILCNNPACHNLGSPEFTDGHFDINGRLAAIRVKIDQLADTISSKAGFASGTAISASYSAADSDLKTALDRAAYNYNFIKNDRSFGFHNPSYAEKLIDLSLADLANY
jgi:formate-dependent nitrite reductase cytochrome c552 subunit